MTSVSIARQRAAVEIDESSERHVINTDFLVATEIIGSYIIETLLLPLISFLEDTSRETIEEMELRELANVFEPLHEDSPKAVTPFCFRGWEATRIRIEQREINCFSELQHRYVTSEVISTVIVGSERSSRILLNSFWLRGFQIIYSQFAQESKFVKYSESLRALKDMHGV